MGFSVLTKASVIVLVVLIIYLNDTAAFKNGFIQSINIKNIHIFFFSTYSLEAQTYGLLAPLKNHGLHPQ